MLAAAVGFELQLHPLPEEGLLEQGTAIWPLPAGLEAFQWYTEWRETAPPALETEFVGATTPLGQVVTVSFTNWDVDNSSEVNEAIEVRIKLCVAYIETCKGACAQLVCPTSKVLSAEAQSISRLHISQSCWTHMSMQSVTAAGKHCMKHSACVCHTTHQCQYCHQQ